VRADQLLVERGVAPSRSAAQRLIARGGVRWRSAQGWAVPRKAGEELPDAAEIEVVDDAELRFVSRGGLKLDAALAHCAIDVAGLVCLDVGHGQLDRRLAADARVAAREGINARHLDARDLPVGRFDLIVAALSFISLTLVLPALAPLAAGELLLLVKPQFELQPKDIGKGGIVKDPSAYADVERKLRKACATSSLDVVDWFESAVTGGDGNREFFVRARGRA